MLEWLKTILGDSYTEEIDKKVSDEIGKGFVSRSDFNAVNEAKKGLEKQIGKYNSQLETLKKVDPTELQKQISDLQAENKKNTDDLNNTIAQLKLNSAIDLALAKSGARNGKALRALIDMEKVKLDGDTLLGMDDQIKAIKESDGYLFEDSGEGAPWGIRHEGAPPAKTGVEAAFEKLNPELKVD